MSIKNEKDKIKKPITNDDDIIEDSKRSIILLLIGIILVIGLIIGVIAYSNYKIKNKLNEENEQEEIIDEEEDEIIEEEEQEIIVNNNNNPVVRISNEITKTTYTVEFYKDNEYMGSKTVDSGKNTTGLDLTLEGTQVLRYWYLCDEGESSVFDFESKTVTGNLKLCAKIVNYYEVKFLNLDETKVLTSQIIESGKLITDIPEEDLIFKIGEGYKKITGWYLDKEWINKFDLTSPVTDNITLYAKYETIYQVLFYLEELEDYVDYEGEYKEVYVIEKEKAEFLEYSDPSDPSGKVVKNWYLLDLSTEPITKDLYNFEDEVISNLILVPTFGYRLTYDTTGGSEIKAIVLSEGEKLVKPADNPTKEGYKFKNWIYEDETEVNFDSLIEGNTIIYATWDAAVTFESNGGSNVDPQIPNLDGKIDKPADPKKEGYTFDGWYYNIDFTGNKVDFDLDVFEVPEVLYAKWIANEYTLTYDVNGGTSSLEDGENYVDTHKTAEEFTLHDLSEEYTNEDCELLGWSTTADGEVEFELDGNYKMPPENTTIYAVWSEKLPV